MTDLSFSVNDTVGISEYFKAETELDMSIFLTEFKRHEQEYLKIKADSEIILAFINLQIYMECFLHQNMRRVVGFEFKPPRIAIANKWEDGEGRKIPEKITNFTTLFFSPVPVDVSNAAQTIMDNFKKVSGIRNLLAHGHKIGTWSDSDGNAGSTRAKAFLTEAQLNQSKEDVNILGMKWNKLLDLILPQCKALQRVNDFKFEKIQ